MTQANAFWEFRDQINLIGCNTVNNTTLTNDIIDQFKYLLTEAGIYSCLSVMPGY